MLPDPDWLPPKYNTNGIWEDVVKELYNIFQNDFVFKICYYDSYRINFDTCKINSPYEEGFWHVISKKNWSTGEREPDFPRAQKLPWCRPSIENFNDPLIQCWDYIESNGRTRTYIWLKDFDYLVIIEKRKRVAFLVTAFHVSGSSERESLNTKYSNRVF